MTLVAGLVAALIVLGIAFVALKANPHNSIVKAVHDAAHFLVGPFDRLFTPKDARLAVAIDWGIAAVVYVILGRLVARLLTALDSRF